MPELIISLKGREIQKFPLTQRMVKIGRSQANDLTLSNESVSREHARLGFVNHCFFVEQVSESNAVLVNGTPCPHPLEIQDGDRIQVGKYTITLSKLTGPSLGLIDGDDFGNFNATAVLSSVDINRYVQISDNPSDAHRSLEQIRLEKVQSLERLVIWLKSALLMSLLINLYFLFQL